MKRQKKKRLILRIFRNLICIGLFVILAALLGKYGYVANQVQNPAVLSIMRHSFTTIPGVLWIVTAIVLFFYRLNKKRYNEIVEDLKKQHKINPRY